MMTALPLYFALLLFGCLLAPTDELVVTTGPVVLHAGPGSNHPGVLELPAGALLRRGQTHGMFVEVRVPQGFPVYLHGDYARIDLQRATVNASGERVNLRLLPSVAGTVPVGQVGEVDGELVLLDVEGSWLRVLAPLDAHLFAPSSALEAGGSASAWEDALATRERRRTDRLLAREVSRPGWLDDLRTQHEAQYLGRTDLVAQDDQRLDALLLELEAMQSRTTSVDTQALLEDLALAVKTERARRKNALDSAQRRLEAARSAAENLEREARTLATGLRFLGQGDSVTITGRVARLSMSSAQLAIYSISDSRGRRFKLTAARDVADLSSLAERTVTLRGRSISLVNVSGPVLVIDQVDHVRQ
ncbi:MAG: hypothetical protein DRQ55_17960 [Planctomycetota bacterium]|nr:MAG: hypothetical protein DRQ55_17960 [Planctomycetota bacterium]